MEYRITFSGQGEFLIISPRILNTLIEKIHNSGKLELSIQVGDIMSESYREYILNVINSNREDSYFCFSNIPENPITMKQLYQITEEQMKNLDIGKEKCFERIRLLEKKGKLLEINCSEVFWIACQDSESVFIYQYANGMEEKILIEVEKNRGV